jgi:hypothetical protein
VVSLTRIAHRDDPQLGRIKAALEGKTYMNLKVLACPAGGEFEVGVVGYYDKGDGSKGCYSDEDVLGMVLMVLCDNLRDPADRAHFGV